MPIFAWFALLSETEKSQTIHHSIGWSRSDIQERYANLLHPVDLERDLDREARKRLICSIPSEISAEEHQYACEKLSSQIVVEVVVPSPDAATIVEVEVNRRPSLVVVVVIVFPPKYNTTSATATQ